VRKWSAQKMTEPIAWNPALYQSGHGFVWEYGKELLPLLDPRPGQRILDLGCGTGQLTAEIARSGAHVIGLDSSAGMIEEARRLHPALSFESGNATTLHFESAFDGVFSNAVLHWVREADRAVAGVCRALKPGGRFVAEFGGYGNIRHLLDAAYGAMGALGIARPEDLNPWYFPTIGEYAGVLEGNGLSVTAAWLFDRMTPLEGGRDGLFQWMEMFGGAFLEALPKDQWPAFRSEFETRAAPALLHDGIWTADYRRLRVVAVR